MNLPPFPPSLKDMQFASKTFQQETFEQNSSSQLNKSFLLVHFLAKKCVRDTFSTIPQNLKC
jgi:hypothetical protein